MKFELKLVSKEGIPAALQKAERYRLLNEPWQAESICRDVLRAEPAHQQALIMLVLAMTDQFPTEGSKRAEEIRQLLEQLQDKYQRAYHTGIFWERRAIAKLAIQTAAGGHIAYDWLRRAMASYEEAEGLKPAGNEEALLRWNTCARAIMRHEILRPNLEPSVESQLE